MKDFDPNAASSTDSGIFGLSFLKEESDLVLVPVPWDVTTSYKAGTANGPNAILNASKQVDLFDLELGSFYERGIAMLPLSKDIISMNKKYRPLAKTVIDAGGIRNGEKELVNNADLVNTGSNQLNDIIYEKVKSLREQKKLVGIVGGEHSTPFGAIKALLEEHPTMGILQIDAHADLRKAYEGFEFSHASIMYNVMTKLPCTSLTQVGIRDFCKEENIMIQKESKRITTFFDENLSASIAKGTLWEALCQKIIDTLPEKVFISFDIDGLEPDLCPHTGTPVPGGLSFRQATQLISALGKSGKKIVGFDLNEVAPGNDEWDGNVGARILWKLCGWMLKTN